VILTNFNKKESMQNKQEINSQVFPQHQVMAHKGQLGQKAIFNRQCQQPQLLENSVVLALKIWQSLDITSQGSLVKLMIHMLRQIPILPQISQRKRVFLKTLKRRKRKRRRRVRKMTLTLPMIPQMIQTLHQVTVKKKNLKNQRD